MVQCERDEFIMDALHLRGQCSTLELQQLNACRMHLQVARLSDITSADGMRIRPGILLGTNENVFKSSSRWPRQGRPPAEWWKLWRKKAQLVFSKDGASPFLRTKLGPWLATVLPTEWTVLAYTSAAYTEVYRRRAITTY